MSDVYDVGGGSEEEAVPLDVDGGQPQGFLSLLLLQLHLRPNLPRQLQVIHVETPSNCSIQRRRGGGARVPERVLVRRERAKCGEIRVVCNCSD